MFNVMLWNYRFKAALGGSRWCDYCSSFATFCFSWRRELCILRHYFSSFQSMHKSVLSSREEEPFNLNPEMKSFIPFQTALWPIRLGKQVSLALLSKRSSPSLCHDVNSHYPVTTMLAAWDGGKEGIKCIHVCFFKAIGKKSVPETVLSKVSFKERSCLVPKQKTKERRTSHNALSPAGLLRSITSFSSSTAWNVENPTGLGFWCRGPNLTFLLILIFSSLWVLYLDRWL